MRLTDDATSLVCQYIDNGTIASEFRLDLVLDHAAYLAKKTCDPIISAKVMATALRECFTRGLFDHREDDPFRNDVDRHPHVEWRGY